MQKSLIIKVWEEMRLESEVLWKTILYLLKYKNTYLFRVSRHFMSLMAFEGILYFRKYQLGKGWIKALVFYAIHRKRSRD